MTIKCVLFDFDGTLADTALDLGGALNALRIENNMPPIAMDLIRPIASHGANALIKLGFNITKDSEEHAYWRQRYLDEYAKCYKDSTVLFDGINVMIDDLVKSNVKWGIVTNKPHKFTDPLVESIGFEHTPMVVVSGDTCDEAKPSAKPIEHAMNQLAVQKDETIYVGDAKRDIEAAHNAGLKGILCHYGYLTWQDKQESWDEDYRVHSVKELHETLNSLVK